MLVKIKRVKADRTHWATGVSAGGAVQGWADEVGAVAVLEERARAVAAHYAVRVNGGRITFHDAETGKECLPAVENREAPAKVVPVTVNVVALTAERDEFRKKVQRLGDRIEELQTAHEAEIEEIEAGHKAELDRLTAANDALKVKVAELEAIIATTK